MPLATVEDLASAGQLDALKAAGRTHAARIRQLLASVVNAQAKAVINWRTDTVVRILEGTRDPATAAAAVKELEEARAQFERLAGQGAPKASGMGHMGGAPEGADLEAIRAANRASLGLGAPDFGPLASNLLGVAVKNVTLKTTVTPEMNYAPGAPGQPSQVTNASGGPGEFILQLLKPEVDIQTPGGTVTMAPYGVPTSNYFWPAVAVVTVGLVTIGYFALEGVKHKIRSRRRAR